MSSASLSAASSLGAARAPSLRLRAAAAAAPAAAAADDDDAPPPRRCRRVVFSPFIMRGGEGRAATKDDDCGRSNKRKKARSLFFEGAMEIGAMENEFEDSKIWFYQSRNP
jgi:hypothetical protein